MKVKIFSYKDLEGKVKSVSRSNRGITDVDLETFEASEIYS